MYDTPFINGLGNTLENLSLVRYFGDHISDKDGYCADSETELICIHAYGGIVPTMIIFISSFVITLFGEVLSMLVIGTNTKRYWLLAIPTVILCTVVPTIVFIQFDSIALCFLLTCYFLLVKCPSSSLDNKNTLFMFYKSIDEWVEKDSTQRKLSWKTRFNIERFVGRLAFRLINLIPKCPCGCNRSAELMRWEALGYKVKGQGETGVRFENENKVAIYNLGSDILIERFFIAQHK